MRSDWDLDVFAHPSTIVWQERAGGEAVHEVLENLSADFRGRAISWNLRFLSYLSRAFFLSSFIHSPLYSTICVSC